MGFPGRTTGKEPACQCRRCERGRFDPWVRKIPEGGHGNPHQCPRLENPMDREPGGLQSTASQRVGGDWSDLSLIRDTPDHSNWRSAYSSHHFQVLFTLRNEVSQSEGPNISAVEYLLFDWSQELGGTPLPATRREEIEQKRQMVMITFSIQHHSDLVVTYESVFGDAEVY